MEKQHFEIRIVVDINFLVETLVRVKTFEQDDNFKVKKNTKQSNCKEQTYVNMNV